MNRGQITIKDIARELGISKSTVSRALRGHPNVKEETRKIILAKAEELHYEPDQVALSLVSRKTHTIGMVVPDISFAYFSHALSGAQRVAAAAGYNVIICQTLESYETEKSVIRTLMSQRVDGLIISLSRETQDYDHISVLHQRGIPVVLFDRVFGSRVLPHVVVDNYMGAYEATKHLLDQGYRRIAHIAGPQWLLVFQPT